MIRVLNIQLRILLLVVTAMAFVFSAHAQTSTTGSATTSWGGYNWQVDHGTKTTTLTSTASFNSTPPGLVDIPVTIPASTTVHEVHGNITLTVWQAGSCGNGSIIVEVRDGQNFNVIAAAKLQQFGPATINVPVSGTFSTAISISSLQLQYYVDECGAQTVSTALSMN